MHRLCTVLAAIFVAAIAATRAFAGTSVSYGIQDDAWLQFGPGTVEQRVATLKGLGLGVVRVTVRWDQVEQQRDTFDWDEPDTVLEQLHTAGIEAVVTLYGTPGGQRRPGAERGSDPRGRLRDVRRRGGGALPERPPVDDLERAEPATMAFDGLAHAVRDERSSIRHTGPSTMPRRRRGSPVA